MKKIYLLMTAVLVALTSFAAPKLAGSEMNIQLKDGAREQLAKARHELNQKATDGKIAPMRTWTDANGIVWNAVILNQGGLWEYFVKDSEGTRFTPEELPAYVVMMRVYSSDYNYSYNLDLGYPSQAIFYETIEEAIAAVGEENLYKPAPLDWMIDFEFAYLSSEEGIPYAGIMDPYWFGSTCTYNGEEDYTIGSNTTLKFTAYDPELSWLDFTLTGSLEGSVTRNISMNYSGESAIFGLTETSVSFEPAQVHIFNTGVMDYETSDWALVYLTEFEPVTRYWMMFCSEGFAYSDENGAPLELVYADGSPAGTSYSATELPGLMPVQIAQDAVMKIGWGAMFASAESEKPYGRWTLPTGYEYDEDYSVLNPVVAYELLLGGYNNQVSEQDGFCVIDENFYYHNPQLSETEFVVGDAKEGMRFTYRDNYGDIWDIQYMDNIFYHSNPEDYTVVELLPAIGTESLYEGLVDSAVEEIAMPETEKINVKVVGNSIVAPEGAEVYNLNGVRVNANDLENGLYIVKVGKNAVKVVL